MHLRSALPITATALALLLGLLGTGAATAQQPAPADGSPGDIVTAAPTSFHPLPGQPTRTRAWHLTYRSTTANGTPNTVSGTVLVPNDSNKSPRPLITYAVGTVGLADSCAPSAGFPKGTTMEANLIQQLTNRGWAVAVTDYEGLGTPGDHTYTVGRAEGQAVLDAARAAERLPETGAAGVTKDSPVGIMGYSQGGQASSWAAELHRSYAPELKVKGTATGGVPADLLKVADANNGNIGGGLILMAAIGQNAAFPKLHLDRYLNDKGRHYVDLLRNNCVAINVAAGLFKKISDVTIKNPLHEPNWQARLRESTLGTRTPDAPVYLYHSTADELIPYAVGKHLRANWCTKGARVQWSSIPLSEHVAGAIIGSIPAANWLANRFTNRPTAGNCN